MDVATSGLRTTRCSAGLAWTSLLPLDHDAEMPTDISALAKRLVDCAAAAQAEEDGNAQTPAVLRRYREDARAVTAAVLQALLPVRKSAGEVVLEAPELGRVSLAELIAAVEAVEVP